MRTRSLLVAASLAGGLAAGCADRLSGASGAPGGGVPAGGGGGVAVPGAEARAVFGLVSAVGGAVDGEGLVRLAWTAPAERETLRFALFVGPDAATLFDAPPAAVEPSGYALVLDGLPVDQDLLAGLGVAEADGTRWQPAGPLLAVRTAAPVYVDPLAPAAGADGETPETAFPEIVLGTLTAFVSGRPVWVAGGEFEDTALTLFGGVQLYGGFAPGLELAERDPVRHASRLLGRAGAAVVAAQAGAAPVVLDGFTIDGLGLASDGVDVPSTPARLSALSIARCGRGVKLRAAEFGAPLEVVVAGCEVRECTLEGLSGEGALALALDGSRFEANGQEGAELGALVAPDGGVAAVTARACLFAGNALEGLDVDLAAPGAGGAAGGRFDVHVEACDFLGNGQDGLLVDLDYEQFPAWTASVLVRGCAARANRAAGVHVDQDASATTLLHRLSASANAGDGVLVTSESATGIVTLSASALHANLGFGARAAVGNVVLVASHCAFVGNLAGGLASPAVEGVAVSCVAHLQPAPFGGAHVRACVVTEDPLDPPFQHVPRALARVVGASGTALALAASPGVGAGSTLEVADDGVARLAASFGAASVVCEPFPEALATPTVAAFFAPGSPAVESFRPSAASPALGAGLSPPSGPPTDAGPFGSPGGGVPGTEDRRPAPLLHLATVNPALTAPLGQREPRLLAFEGGAPTAASLAAGIVVTDADGRPVEAPAFLDGERVVVTAPVGGWPAGGAVELHAGLATADGRPLAAPLVLPLP